MSAKLLVVAITAAVCVVAVRAEDKRLMNCDFNSKSLGDCDAVGYGLRAGAFIVPGIVMALITLITCPFFFCARMCCGCCGGSDPTPGCCCSGKGAAIYSVMDIVRPKVYTLVLVGLGIGLGIWGNLASDLTTKGLLGLVDDLELAPARLLHHVERVQQQLNVTRYDTTTDKEYAQDLFNGTTAKADAVKVKEDIEKILKENAATFRQYVLNYNFIMFIIFCLPIGAVLVGGVAAVCNCRSCLPMLTVFIMFIVGFILWLSHGIFSGIALVSGDLCAEVSGLVEDKQTVLRAITGCDDSTVRKFLDSFVSIESDVAKDSCRQIQLLCYDNAKTTSTNMNEGRIFQCSSGLDCNSNVRFGDLVRYTESGLYVDDRVNNFPGAQAAGHTCSDLSTQCTPARCAELCRRTSDGGRSEAGKVSKLMRTSFLAASQVATTLDTLGGEYGTCDSLAGLLLAPFDSNCKTFATGTLGMRQSSGLGGVMVIGFVFVMAWGSKRFISLPTADENEDDNIDLSMSDDPVKKDPSILPHSS